MSKLGANLAVVYFPDCNDFLEDNASSNYTCSWHALPYSQLENS